MKADASKCAEALPYGPEVLEPTTGPTAFFSNLYKDVMHRRLVQVVMPTGTTGPSDMVITYDFDGPAKTLEARLADAVSIGQNVTWTVDYGHTHEVIQGVWRYSRGASSTKFCGKGTTGFSNDDGAWGAAASQPVDGKISRVPYDFWGVGNFNLGDANQCGNLYRKGRIEAMAGMKQLIYLIPTGDIVPPTCPGSGFSFVSTSSSLSRGGSASLISVSSSSFSSSRGGEEYLELQRELQPALSAAVVAAKAKAAKAKAAAADAARGSSFGKPKATGAGAPPPTCDSSGGPPENARLFAITTAQQCARNLPYGSEALKENEAKAYFSNRYKDVNHTQWVQLIHPDGVSSCEDVMITYNFSKAMTLEERLKSAATTPEQVTWTVQLAKEKDSKKVTGTFAFGKGFNASAGFWCGAGPNAWAWKGAALGAGATVDGTTPSPAADFYGLGSFGGTDDMGCAGFYVAGKKTMKYLMRNYMYIVGNPVSSTCPASSFTLDVLSFNTVLAKEIERNATLSAEQAKAVFDNWLKVTKGGFNSLATSPPPTVEVSMTTPVDPLVVAQEENDPAVTKMITTIMGDPGVVFPTTTPGPTLAATPAPDPTKPISTTPLPPPWSPGLGTSSGHSSPGARPYGGGLEYTTTPVPGLGPLTPVTPPKPKMAKFTISVVYRPGTNHLDATQQVREMVRNLTSCGQGLYVRYPASIVRLNRDFGRDSRGFMPLPDMNCEPSTLGLGHSPGGHKNGPLSHFVTAGDIAKEAMRLDTHVNNWITDVDENTKQAAMAHFKAMNFDPMVLPTVLPSGPLPLPFEPMFS